MLQILLKSIRYNQLLKKDRLHQLCLGPKMTLLVPVLSKVPHLLKELSRVLPNVQFHEVQNPAIDPHFKKSEILICDFDLLGPYLYDLPNAKWVQGTWAGIEKLLLSVQNNKPIPYKITRFTGEQFGKIMSEYVIANIVNHERNVFQVKCNQKNQQWVKEGKIVDYRIISDMTIGILGLGHIGNRIGQMLHMLGAKVLAFGRRPAQPQGLEYNYVTKYHTKETLNMLLQDSDYIISVLPHTEDTNSLLDKDILKNCADKQSILINIGRSNILSEDSLIKAINNKWISAAIIDVFDVEPLPETSRLWKMEQVFITPHVAAMSRSRDIAELFQSNLDAYMKNLEPSAVIDFSRGY